MKTIQNFLILALLGLFVQVNAQVCEPTWPLGSVEGRSVLGLIMGSHPHLEAKGIEQSRAAWQEKQPSWDRSYALAILARRSGAQMAPQEHPLMDTNAVDADLLRESGKLAQAHYYEGLVQMVDRNFGLAVQSFNASELQGSLEGECRLPYFKTAAQYLDKYGTQVPLFKGFNGGFYNFTCDSLQWRFQKPDSADFHKMLLSLMDLSVISGQQPVYHELLGDLLIHHPDQITANWFGAMTYFKLAFDIPASKGILEEKAIYALEAPKTSRRTFDMYQFNQLRKRLESDLEAVAGMRKDYAAAESTAITAGKSAIEELKAEAAKQSEGLKSGDPFFWMLPNEPGEIPQIIREADLRHAASAGKEAKFAGEVTMKNVKGEAKFNFYGIAMILVVIGAVAFLWWQLRKNRYRDV